MNDRLAPSNFTHQIFDFNGKNMEFVYKKQ